jgi:hypothetical protein
MKQTHVILALALAASAIALVALRGTVARPAAPESAPLAVAAPAKATLELDRFAGPVERQPRAQLPPPVPLPAPDTQSIQELLEALEAPARRGDVQAACRLATELLRCRYVTRWDERSTRIAIEGLARSDLAGEVLERRTRELAETEAYNLAARERCAGLSPEALRRIPRYAFLAASAGHVPSMVLFADAAGVSGADIVADPELYAAYRAHAWPMFRRAFEAGHPRAVRAWVSALESHGFHFLAGVMPPEWRTPGVARALLQRLQRGSGPPARSTPSSALMPGTPPTEQDRAEADALYARHFADSPWLSAQQTQLPLANGRFLLDERLCAGP